MGYSAKTYIGIDPDVDGSGYAVVLPDGGISCVNLSVPEILRDAGMRQQGRTVFVIEAAWLTGKANWHFSGGENRRVSSAMGYSIGRNHQAGMDIAALLRHMGHEVREVRPLKKFWRGRDGKITHAELCRLTGWTVARSNQEQRDALLLAWVESGRSMRM